MSKAVPQQRRTGIVGGSGDMGQTMGWRKTSGAHIEVVCVLLLTEAQNNLRQKVKAPEQLRKA